MTVRVDWPIAQTTWPRARTDGLAAPSSPGIFREQASSAQAASSVGPQSVSQSVRRRRVTRNRSWLGRYLGMSCSSPAPRRALVGDTTRRDGAGRAIRSEGRTTFPANPRLCVPSSRALPAVPIVRRPAGPLLSPPLTPCKGRSDWGDAQAHVLMLISRLGSRILGGTVP